MNQAKEPLQRVVAGKPISAADWNRIVDRINAGATATVRAKTPTARVESQIVQVANVGKRDVEFLQPVFSTGTLRIEGADAALSGSGKLRDQAGVAAALNNAFVVEVDDSGVDKTGEGSGYDSSRSALTFVALEPIPVGGVGRALAACGPIFLANMYAPAAKLGYALPYTGGTGYFFRKADPPGYAVVASQSGAGRRVALLGYWEQAPDLELTYSSYLQEVVEDVVFEEDVKGGVRPLESVELERAKSIMMGGEFSEDGDYDEEFTFHGVYDCELITIKIIVATRFNHDEYPDSVRIIVDKGDGYDDSSLRAAGYAISVSEFSVNNVRPVRHRLGFRYGNLMPKYRLSSMSKKVPVYGDFVVTARSETRQNAR